MNEFSIPMAIVDFIPVLIFFASAVILQRDLYNKLSKGAFALLAAGSIMVLMGGIYKATWKLLYALGICDFVSLNAAFFPLQAPGFLLFFISLLSLDRKKSGNKALAVVPYTSNILFIIGQTVGLGGTQILLVLKAKRIGRTKAVIMFVVSFILMLAMGYLGSKFDNSSSMNWIAQVTNTLSQVSLFLGVMDLHKNGLANQDVFD